MNVQDYIGKTVYEVRDPCFDMVQRQIDRVVWSSADENNYSVGLVCIGEHFFSKDGWLPMTWARLDAINDDLLDSVFFFSYDKACERILRNINERKMRVAGVIG